MSRKVFLPDQPLRKIWNYLILLATIWYVWTIPLFLVPVIDVPIWSHWVDAGLTLLYAIDILINFRTAFFMDGEMVVNINIVRKKYLTSYFALDLVATIPWDMLFILMGNFATATLLTTVRLIRIFRLPNLLRVQGAALPPSQSERILAMSFWIISMTSWCACVWMMILGNPQNEDLVTYIIKAYYWTVTTMASVGYGDITPTTNLGRIYAMFVMILGVGMYAFIIGNISSMIVNVNAFRKQNMEKIEQLGAFIHQYDLPPRLKHDIFSFYRHYLMDHSIDGQGPLKDLPPKLRERLNQHVNVHLLRRGPMFKKASQELLEALGARLTSEMFLPGEEIIRIGDVGHEMYILMHGVVAVTNKDGELLAKLRTKDIFGEIALLHDTVRIANIRAITACNTLKLEKKDFDEVVASFPEFHQELKKVHEVRVGNDPPSFS